jgi:hypothetical protein
MPVFGCLIAVIRKRAGGLPIVTPYLILGADSSRSDSVERLPDSLVEVLRRSLCPAGLANEGESWAERS